MKFRGIAAAAALFTLFLAVCLGGGCGYRIGTLGHPQIKSIAVAAVTNETTSYNAAAQARSILCESIVTDGTLKLTHLSTADCILYAKVTSISFSEVSWSKREKDKNFVPNQWKVVIEMDYSVILPGQAQPLSSGTVSGSAQFMTGPDMEIGRLNGIRQALLAAAKNIVIAITEGW